MNKLKVLGSSSEGNCYLLLLEGETLIIEAGITYKEILKGLDFEIANVVGCLVTHEHKDHSKAVKDLIKNGIDVYSSQGTFEKLKVENYRTKVIKAMKWQRIGNFNILPFPVKHDAKEPLGFLIKHKAIGSLLFITDTCYCEYAFKNVNNILVECNFVKDVLDKRDIPNSLKNRIVETHFELDNVAAFLKASDLSKVKNIMLIHASHENSDKEVIRDRIEGVTGLPIIFANKGLEIGL